MGAVALPGAAAAQTTFSITIDNNSGHDWSQGVIAVLPTGSSPNVLIDPGAAPTSGDQYATYGYGHGTCNDVVTAGEANALITAFSSLTLDDNAYIVPALANGDSTTVNVDVDDGEVLSFIAYVTGSEDDVVVAHETGDNSDVSVDLFDADGLPIPDAGFEISGFDLNSASDTDGTGTDCSSACAPPASGCFVAAGTSTVGAGAGTGEGGSGTFDFDTALWTRTETGFTTDTIAVGDVFSGNAGDEIVVLMQGGIYYSTTNSVGAGKTVVLDQDGTLIKTHIPGAGRDIMGPITITDIDGAAPDEYLVGEALSREDNGALMAIDANTSGASAPDMAWFQSPRGYPGFWNLGPSVADVTGTSDAEIISPSYEGVLQILTPGASSATVVDQIDLFATYGEYHYGHAAVADLDGDGTNEIAVAGATLGQVIILQSDGDNTNNTMTQLFLSDVNSADGVAFGSGPAIANIDDDPELEVIVALTHTTGGRTGYVRAYDMVNGPGTGCEYQWTLDNVQGFRWVSPVVGDVDNDGTQEIVMQGNSGKLSVLSTEGVTAGASCVEGTVEARTYVGGSWSWFTPGLANLTGEEGLEIVAAGYEVLEVLEMETSNKLRVKYRATEPEATFYASPTIMPGIDGAGGPAARITVNGWLNGVIYQYGTQNTDNTPQPWNTFGGNNARTGGPVVPVYGGAFHQDGDGFAVMEAENFHSNNAPTGGGTAVWFESSAVADSSSGAYMVTADNNKTINSNYPTDAPRLDYRVNFNRTGTHYVWVRSNPPDHKSDTLHVGINGAPDDSSNRVAGFTENVWTWSKDTLNNAPDATVEVPSVGVHTINVWMREDGATVDKILITDDPTFVPTGFGPAQSLR